MARRPTARQLANPGERAKIPTNMLPPKYRAARLRRIKMEELDKSALYQPTKTLAGRDLRDTVNKLVDAETRPQMDALEREGRNVATQGGALRGKTTDLYRELAAKEAGRASLQQALAARLRASQAAVAGRNTSDVAQSTANAAATFGDRAGLEGSGAARLAGEGQALAARAADQNAQFQQAGELQSAGFQGLQGAMAGVTAMRGGEVDERIATRLQNRLIENEGEQRTIRANRGALAAKYATDLRQQSFGNILAAKEFGLEEQQLAAKTAQDKRDSELAAKKEENARKDKAAQRRLQRKGQLTAAETARLGRINARILARERNQTSRDNNAATNASKSDDAIKPLTPLQRQEQRNKSAASWNKVESARGLISSGIKVKTGKQDKNGNDILKPATTEQTKAALREKGYSEWQIEAAIALRHRGGKYLPKSVIDLIHSSAPEVRIPNKYRTKPKSPSRRSGTGLPSPTNQIL